MYAFLLTQMIGLSLFFTINYGLLSYIQYRKNQLKGGTEVRAERFVLRNATAALYFLLVGGFIYRINHIHQYLNIDYGYLMIKTLITVNSAQSLISI